MATELNDIGQFAKDKIMEQWIAAGHPTWGRFVDNLKHEVVMKGRDFSIRVISLKYGIYMNYGVKADRVVRSRAYISAIFAWVQKKLGISDERQARQVTWFIGEKHKRDGIPGSGFIDKMREETDQEITKMVAEHLNTEIVKIWH